MTGPSAEETVELMRAMGAINVQMPTTQLGIADNSLSPQQQTAFGELLMNLGQLVREHAQKRHDATSGTDRVPDE